MTAFRRVGFAVALLMLFRKGPHPLPRGGHQRAVKRGRHRKRDRALCAPRRAALAGAPDGRRVARDDGLLRRVEVRGRDDFAASYLRARRFDLLRWKPDDGRHRADAGGHRLLHETPPFANEPQRVREGKGSDRDIGGVFAERVSRGERRPVEAMGKARFEVAQGGNGMGEDRRLRVHRHSQLLLGPFEAEAGKRESEHGIRLVEDLPRGPGDRRERPPHADRLRALTGKQEGELHDRFRPFLRWGPTTAPAPSPRPGPRRTRS